MQRVVLLFAAILSVARASPFGLDQDRDLPTPFRNAFIPGDDSLPDQEDILGGLELCGNLDASGTPVIPEGGCVYTSDEDIYFIQVLRAATILPLLQGVYIKECENATGNILDVQENCYILSDDSESLYYFNVFDLDAFDLINDFADRFGEIGMCDVPTVSFPQEGCVFLVNGTIGIMNILNKDNTDSLTQDLDDYFTKCQFDEDFKRLTKGTCYWVYDLIGAIYFFGINDVEIVEDVQRTFESAKAFNFRPTLI